MPWIYRDYFQLGILLCCVPLQFYLSNSRDSSGQNKEILEVVSYLKSVKDNFFDSNSWKSCWTDFLSWLVTNVLGIPKEAETESPAVEVLEYREKHGIKGKHTVKSEIMHDVRPEILRFRVGQVVEHVHGGFKGVVIEWEYNPKKPEPMYTLLLDTESAIYVADVIIVEQKQLYSLQHTQIKNPLIKNYFSAFDGTQYIPQPWLQKLYPKD